MSNRQSSGVLRGLCQLVEAQAQLTDNQLLHRFAAYRDERAFAALLQRHGGLVYGVCRNILRHEHDAEDAFQGTFLVLARQAGAIRQEKAVGSWLYRVAYRVAMKARKAAQRRRQQESQAARDPEEQPACGLAWRELQGILDEELNRLPDKYRAPFVLCCLTGKSKSEAAAELGWKEGTVSSRLAQARKLLQARLARRGVTFSAVLSGLAIAQNAATAAVPAGLLASTQKAALAFAAGEVLAGAASIPASLARDVLWGMVLARLKVAAMILALVGLVGGAAAVVLPRRPAPDAPAAAPAQTARGGPDAPEPGKRMAVGGFVVGPDGKPVPGARVAVMAAQRPRPGERGMPAALITQQLGQGRADGQGRFRLWVPQTTAEHYRLTALASAPGYALSSHMADPATVTASEHTLPLQLIRGQAVRVRLIDQDGQPARRVRVHVLGMARDGPPGVLVLYYQPPVPLPGWPGPVTTDDDGQFTLRDIGPQTQVHLQVRDERFAVQWLSFRTGKQQQPQPVVLSLSPARILEGRLTAEDTGQPLANVALVVETGAPGALRGYVEGRTDRDGRYRVRPFPGKRLTVWAHPPHEMPYLALSQGLEWPAGAARQRADLSLPRGVLVRGTVKEARSARPVAGAAVRYEWAYRDNPFRTRATARRGAQWQIRDARTKPDGAFCLAVPPGPGNLLVKAAEPDFVHVQTSLGFLLDGRKGGTPYFPDARVPLHLQPMDEIRQLAVLLRRGVTVRGRVVGPDGRPVASALLLAPTYIPEGWEVKGHTLPVRDGHFELPGCEPGQKVRVWVYDPGKKQGAVAEFTANAGAGPEVRLAPGVGVRVRLVDKAGQAIAQPQTAVDLVLRPGDSINDSLQKGTQARITVRASLVFGRGCEPATAGAGNVLFSNLIPGAQYTIRAEEKIAWPEKLAFTAPPSGSRDLGVLAIDPRH
jgi:RNA polymerase sigma factor (sigma-70 family)